MEIKTVIADGEQWERVFMNLIPLYLHDISEFEPALPNAYGVLEPENVRTLEEQAEVHCDWLEQPGILYPYLILVDGRPAGFNLVAARSQAPPGVDYCVREFFLLHAYRGKSIGQQAAAQVFERLRGRWQIDVQPRNKSALCFWRGTLEEYAPGWYRECEEETLFGLRIVFRFDNITRDELKPQPGLIVRAGANGVATMTHAEQILYAVSLLADGQELAAFSREEIRHQLGIPREEWNASYSPTFQAMRADHPGGASKIGARFHNIFRRVSHGRYVLTDYGRQLLLPTNPHSR